MPNPAGLNTTVLHMKYVEPNAAATPLQGTLTFTPSPSPILFPTQNVIVAGTETVTLDVNGEATIELISTDQAGENPTGWLYTVTEKIVGQKQRTFNIALPFNSNVTVELSDIEPTDAAPTYVPVVGPQGAPGVITTINGYSASTVTLAAADVGAIPTTAEGVANGVATLDATTKIPVAQIPDLSGTYILSSKINAANGVAGLGAGGLVGSAQLDLATLVPPSVGTGAVGTATHLARSDHTHDGVDLTSNQSISGTKTFTGTIAANLVTATAASGTIIRNVQVTGDTSPRFSQLAQGDMQFGPGNAAADVTFSRTAAGVLSSSGQLASTAAAPSAVSHLTRKDYVDNNFSSLTGAQTISGVKTYTSAPIMQASSAGTVVQKYQVTGDATPRLTIGADGTLSFGPGNAAADLVVSRSSSAALAVNNAVRVTQAATSSVSFATIIGGDTFDRYRTYMDGKQEWGPGTAARDVNLYRVSTGLLQTDQSLKVAGQLTVGTWGLYVISDWVALSSVGTWQNGAAAGTPAPKIRKIMLFGTEVWEMQGVINLSSWTGATLFSFTNGASSGYAPAHEHDWTIVPGAGASVTAPARTYWNPAGNIGISPNPSTPSGFSPISLDAYRIVNPLDV